MRPDRDKAGRALIVTADDFGMSREVNAAVIKAFEMGILTAASLMVTGSAVEQAVAIAKEHPDLDVGLHIVVCRGLSVLPPAKLGGLVDTDGSFPQQPITAGLRFFFNRQLRQYLRDELRAQIERHLQLLGYLNHVDGHLNFHVHPVVASILVELAVEYQIPCIRLPREQLLTTLRLARDHWPRKILESIIFKVLCRRMFALMKAREIRTTDWLFGLHQTGHITETYVTELIERLPDGITEIYFHPAEPVGAQAPPDPAQKEALILRSNCVREALSKAGVRLTSFAEIAKAKNRSAFSQQTVEGNPRLYFHA
jgi:hopanoid biosynthesis associated protein HpnK